MRKKSSRVQFGSCEYLTSPEEAAIDYNIIERFTLGLQSKEEDRFISHLMISSLDLSYPISTANPFFHAGITFQASPPHRPTQASETPASVPAPVLEIRMIGYTDCLALPLFIRLTNGNSIGEHVRSDGSAFLWRKSVFSDVWPIMLMEGRCWRWLL